MATFFTHQSNKGADGLLLRAMRRTLMMRNRLGVACWLSWRALGAAVQHAGVRWAVLQTTINKRIEQ